MSEVGDDCRAAPARDAIDEAASILAHPTRRHVLYYLRDHDAAAVDDLVSAVSESGLTSLEARTALLHVHLPKLQEVGVLRHDPAADEVELVALDPALAALLDAASDHELRP